MAISKLKINRIKRKITQILQEKAPDSIRIVRIYEIFGKMGYDVIDVDKAIDELLSEKRVIQDKPKATGVMPADVGSQIKSEYEKREFLKLSSYLGLAIEGSREIEESSVVKFLPYTQLSASEMNEVIDVLVEKINDLNENFDKKIQEETSRIYHQMISIFGVFVSIFAIVVISTDKLISFNPEYLSNNNVWDLFWKSCAIFVPVLMTILLLVVAVRWNGRSRKRNKKNDR